MRSHTRLIHLLWTPCTVLWNRWARYILLAAEPTARDTALQTDVRRFLESSRLHVGLRRLHPWKEVQENMWTFWRAYLYHDRSIQKHHDTIPACQARNAEVRRPFISGHLVCSRSQLSVYGNPQTRDSLRDTGQQRARPLPTLSILLPSKFALCNARIWMPCFRFDRIAQLGVSKLLSTKNVLHAFQVAFEYMETLVPGRLPRAMTASMTAAPTSM